MTTVDVAYLHIGERYYAARFQVPKHKDIKLQVYGATREELEERVVESLNYEFGEGQYEIRKVDA